jgi:hypothetical protein
MTENLFTPRCIRTVSGNYVNVFDPDPDTITIEDIAHSLSNQPRFGGHLPNFYSVAQHSLECSKLIKHEEKFAALMHDASEAYLLDMPSPIKRELSNYKDIENNLMNVIAKKFGFTYPLSEEVKIIDQIMMVNEWEYLMLGSIKLDSKGNRVMFNCYKPGYVRDSFLNAFKQLSQHVPDNKKVL